MTALLTASGEAFTQMTVEFPNLFNGTEISYYRGFNLFGVPIYWYGIIIMVGVILAYLYAMHRVTREFGLVKTRVFDVVFACLIGGFICARIYYCVFTTLNPNSPTNYNFITTFTTIRDGGIAIYGGIIGAVLIGLIMCRIRKVNFFAMADVAALGFLIGQTLGRWGNFVNQEAYGEVCDPKWIFGMTGSSIALENPDGALVHPCFLYESVWCLLGFIFLHFYSKKLRTYDGEIALLYVTWYGFGRMFIESIRTDSLYAGSFRVSQLVAFTSCIAGAVLFVIFKILTKRSGKPLYINTPESAELIEQDRAAEESHKKKKSAAADEENGELKKPEDEDTEESEDKDTEESEDENTEESEDENTEESEDKDTEESEDENTEESENEDTEESEKDNEETEEQE